MFKLGQEIICIETYPGNPSIKKGYKGVVIYTNFTVKDEFSWVDYTVRFDKGEPTGWRMTKNLKKVYNDAPISDRPHWNFTKEDIEQYFRPINNQKIFTDEEYEELLV